MNASIKKIADLENVLGKTLARNLIASAKKGFMKRLPFAVSIVSHKPSFGLNDGGMLNAYAVNLKTGEVLGGHYCGSADSAINHTSEQFSEGYQAPDGHAVIFVETIPNSGNHSWMVTVVTNNVVRQIASAS